MRIIGFSKKWNKLKNPLIFTTFRFPRKDKDWEVEEVVQVVFKPRSKQREFLGIARIIRKEPKDLKKTWNWFPSSHNPNTPDMITPDEAKEDGFDNMSMCGDTEKMKKFFYDTYGYSKCQNEPINKLTLYWIKQEASS